MTKSIRAQDSSTTMQKSVKDTSILLCHSPYSLLNRKYLASSKTDPSISASHRAGVANVHMTKPSFLHGC